MITLEIDLEHNRLWLLLPIGKTNAIFTYGNPCEDETPTEIEAVAQCLVNKYPNIFQIKYAPTKDGGNG